MSKLAERIKQYEIPAIPGQPIGDICLVYRIPSVEKTAGGLYIPETTQDVEERGVLLAAGLTALDKLVDHGVEIGDIVEFARYAGKERIVERKDGAKGKTMLRMKVDDIQLSEDLVERMRDMEIVREEVEGGGQQHFLKSKGSK